MFWGLTLEHGSVYSQVVDRSFHLSMAALGFGSTSADPISIAIEVNKAKYVLCTLQAGVIPQQALSHEFTEGEEICFYILGKSGEVHLTGYVLPTPVECEYEMSDNVSSSASSSGDDEHNIATSSNAVFEGNNYAAFLSQIANDINNSMDADTSDDESDEDYEPKTKKTSVETSLLSPTAVLLNDSVDFDDSDSEDQDFDIEAELAKKSRKKKRKPKAK